MAKKPKPVRIPRPAARAKRADVVCQFLIALAETDPLVWRRIQVPEAYSFWDLHVAIQNAMGWQDYHLHEFHVVHPGRKRLDLIGIPGDEFQDERPCKPGWTVAMSAYFGAAEQPALYVYDFGDNWRHIVMYEGIVSVDPARVYPRCVGGARACPPEDCGGVDGYANYLRAMANKKHPEHTEMLQWRGPFDADAFDPRAVVFDDPRKRWKTAFGPRTGA